MRNIKVALHEDESTTVVPNVVYMGEHHAAQLEITLPQRLRQGFDYYTLSFDQMDKGNRVPLGNIYPGNEGQAYVQNGVIFCTLPEQLTNASFLRAQVEAHRQEGGKMVALEKSALFTVQFEHGLAGQGDTLQSFALGHINKLMAQIDYARERLNEPLMDQELQQLIQQITQTELAAVSDQLSNWAESTIQAAMQATLDDVAAKIDEALRDLELPVLDVAQLEQIQQMIELELAEVSDRLMGFLEDSLQAATSGVVVQHIAAANNGNVTLMPNIRYRITMQGPNVSIVLDDAESAPDFAQEFSFVVQTPASGTPAVNIAYESGKELFPPQNFSVPEPGKIYEVSVLDSLALVAQWEV